MLALGPQRLAFVEVDDLALSLDRRRDAVLPFDSVRIEHELVLGRVIEHRHLVRTHDDEPLLLERMQPAHEDVGLNAARKNKVADRDVADALIQVRAALTCDARRHFVHERQHHRDVVRREAPEDVFFGPDLADVQAVRIEIVDLAERAVSNQPLQPENGRVVLQDVADHQHTAFRSRQLHQRLAVHHVDGERLLDEHVFARLQCRLRHLVVRHGRRRQRHTPDRGIVQEIVEVAVERDVRVLIAAARFRRWFRIAQRRERAQFVEIANEVLAPVAHTDDGDLHVRMSD